MCLLNRFMVAVQAAEAVEVVEAVEVLAAPSRLEALLAGGFRDTRYLGKKNNGIEFIWGAK